MKKRGLNPELINDPNEILVDQVHLDNRVYYCRCALSVSSILMLRFVLSRSFQSFINAILLFYYFVFKVGRSDKEVINEKFEKGMR